MLMRACGLLVGPALSCAATPPRTKPTLEDFFESWQGQNSFKGIETADDLPKMVAAAKEQLQTLNLRRSTGAPDKAWFPNGIDVNDIPIKPGQAAWKSNGPAATAGEKLFASALPNVAAGYNGGKNIRRIRPRHVAGGFPQFTPEGRQIVSRDKPFYTPHISQTSPDARGSQAVNATFTDKELRDPKWFSPYEAKYQRAARNQVNSSNPAYEMVFDTKPGVSIKPRWTIGPDGKLYPTRVGLQTQAQTALKDISRRLESDPSLSGRFWPKELQDHSAVDIMAGKVKLPAAPVQLTVKR